MLCPACHRPMRPLFISYACDYCDGIADVQYQSGFVVLQDPEQIGQSLFYVFRTRTDAAIWRSAQNQQDAPIVEVLTESGLRWRTSNGTLEGLEMADTPFVIYPDHRFPPAPGRAFLADPAMVNAAA